MVFGTLLRQYRRQAGLTLRELGSRARLDFTYLSKLENLVEPAPSSDATVRLAVALGLSGDEEAEFYAAAVLTRYPTHIGNAAIIRNPGLRALLEVAARRELSPATMCIIQDIAEREGQPPTSGNADFSELGAIE